jgi:structural maintenance of chromosome 3 (chondroitin sulfate proteoglycan 6)
MRKYGLTVITNDGDKVDRKGALTGGYHNAQRSRIQAAEQLKRWTTAYQTDSARHAEVTRTLQRLDQEITRLLGQIQIAESKLKQAQTGREPLVAEGTNLRNEVERQASRLVKLEGALGVQETDLRGLKVQLDAYQTELATPMTQNLSAEELHTMTKLGKDIETEKKELVRVTKACAEVCLC